MATPNGEPTVAWFEWGTNVNYGWATSPTDVGAGFNVVRVNHGIAGSLAGELILYRLVSSNASGITLGHPQSFVAGGRPFILGSSSDGNLTNPPPEFDNLVDVAAGPGFWLATRLDGTVVDWWRFPSSGDPDVPTLLKGAVAVAAGRDRGLALLEDGTVAEWSDGSEVPPAGLDRVVEIAASRSIYSKLALRDDGTVVEWGASSLPPGLSNVVAVAPGMALSHDGTVVTWGSAGVESPGLERVVRIANTGSGYLAVRDDGTVVKWGGTSTYVPPGLSNVIAVAGAGPVVSHSLALCSDGTLVGWGASGPATIPPDLARVGAIAASDRLTVAVRAPVPAERVPLASTASPGSVTSTTATLTGMATPSTAPSTAWFEWGTDDHLDQRTADTAIGSGLGVVHVSATLDDLAAGSIYRYRLVVSNQFGIARGAVRLFTTGARVSGWGSGWYGRVLPPPDLSNVVAVAAGDYHGLAIRNDGSLAMWGHYYGRVPVGSPPPDLGPVTAIAGGRSHTLAVTAEGRVRAWGDNSDGQTDVPEGLADVIAVAAGFVHSLALRRDGTVIAWGNTLAVPNGLHNVVAISCGDNHSLALSDHGTITSWPRASGVGPPPSPAGLSNVVAIAAGDDHNAALKADGSVVAWARANYSGLSTVPSTLDPVMALAAGQSVTVALLNDGTVAAWGHTNSYGAALVPTGLRNAVDIACGYELCFALGANTPPQASPRTTSVAIDSGSPVSLSFVDPNGDPLQVRVTRLPAVGALFQYADGGPGEPITVVDQVLTDPAGRLFFVPRPQELGEGYDTVGLTANDGELDSVEVVLTMNVVPVPWIEPDSVAVQPGGGITFTFSGLTNVTYRVHRSTDLTNWVNYAVTQPTPGRFLFQDSASVTIPVRYYRIRVQ